MVLCAFTIVFLFIISCRFPKLQSLSAIICFRYGIHVLKLIRKYEKHDYWLRKTHLDIAFLSSCLDNDHVQLSWIINFHLNGCRILNPIDFPDICFYRKK